MHINVFVHFATPRVDLALSLQHLRPSLKRKRFFKASAMV